MKAKAESKKLKAKKLKAKKLRRPTKAEEAALRAEEARFLNRLCNGSARPARIRRYVEGMKDVDMLVRLDLMVNPVVTRLTGKSKKGEPEYAIHRVAVGEQVGVVYGEKQLGHIHVFR